MAKNILSLIPLILSGQMSLDSVCKEVGLSRRLVPQAELGDALEGVCVAAVSSGVEVYEITGEWNGARCRSLIVMGAKNIALPEKKVL